MFKFLTVFAFALLGTVLGCDEQLVLKNENPTAHQARLLVAECEDEHITYLELSISDPESNPVDLLIQIGNTEQASYVYPGTLGAGMRGLTTSPDGRTHRIHWAHCAERAGPCPIADSLVESDDPCPCAEPPATTADAITVSIALTDSNGDVTTVTEELTQFIPVEHPGCETNDLP